MSCTIEPGGLVSFTKTWGSGHPRSNLWGRPHILGVYPDPGGPTKEGYVKLDPKKPMLYLGLEHPDLSPAQNVYSWILHPDCGRPLKVMHSMLEPLGAAHEEEKEEP